MKTLGVLVLACFAIFCYGQTNTTTTSTTCSSTPLVVGTFNTELIITASGREERSAAQINFLRSSTNLEILCLQELWDPQLRQNFISGLNSTFPYSYYPPNFPISNANCSVACSSSALQQTSQCLSTQNCFQNGNIGDQINCAFSGCRSTFDNLDDSCRACLSVDRENNLDANIRFCTNSGIEARQCIRFFGGYTDNMIFSKYPITNSSYLRFTNSPFTETTVLYSRIQAPQGPVNVFCTHLLPANFRVYSYESVNRNQTQQMISYINSTVQNSTEPILAMGDFNHGPSASNNIQGSWSNNYNLFVTNGFQSALVVSNSNPPCTYCNSNVLVTNGNPNWIIDHIYVKNAGIINSTVFANYNLVQVNNRQVPLSDHYGVAATLCLTGNFTNTNTATSTPGQTTNTIVVVRPGVPSGATELVISSIWVLIAAFLSLF